MPTRSFVRKADVGSEQIFDQTFHARGYSTKKESLAAHELQKVR
jgi:hypothetical protein